MTQEKLTFNEYRSRYMLGFYRKTNGKEIYFKGQKVDKFEAFAELYDRYLKGNSEREILVIVEGVSEDFKIHKKKS